MSRPVAKGRWSQPGFVATAVVLAVAAVGFNTAVAKLQFHFKKLEVPLFKPLASVPAKLGDWVQVSTDESLPPAIEESLAAKTYIFRDYIDTKLVSPDVMKQFDGKSAAERKALMAAVQRQTPEAVINMAVTYYSGGADTVAHVPERCYVADGYVPKSTDTLTWPLGPGRLGPAKPDGNVDVRYIHFVDTTNETKRVAYFFFANGEYQSDNLRVRELLQSLRNKYGFYAKVELMAVVEDDMTARRMMTSFLSASMPDVASCFTDFNEIEHRK